MRSVAVSLKQMCRIVAAASLLAACAGPGDAVSPGPDLPEDLLTGDEAFVEIRKPDALETAAAVRQLGNAPFEVSDGGGDFYLAINRNAFDTRWFLSAYMKQYHFGDAAVAAASSLGTRVVSFKEQNGKLFVFDSSDQFKASELFDPDVLLEAYPIVHVEEFEQLPNSERYVLIDPAAGLNKFLVTGELVADPDLADFGAFPLEVGLSYMQEFRKVTDGAVFEQVFTGTVDFGGGFAPTVWGTLGMSLRRYKVGRGYVPTPDPGTPSPHYFLSDSRIIPDSFFFVDANPVKWNLKPGRAPIKVFITAGALRAQADFPEHDLLGALERGIENWNEVIGYQAFDAVVVDDDRIRDDNQSTALIDYPGAGNGFAFADWRHNPNNGEILGGSVYFGGVFFLILEFFEDDPAEPVELSADDLPADRPAPYSFLWGGMPAQRPACVYWAPDYRTGGLFQQLRGDTSLTAVEKGNNYIEHVMAHEWGHVLGLRHNFKGSLVPPSSSVMEYSLDLTDAPQLNKPGAYDIEAIRFLYGLSDELPAQPFCTDDDLSFDPTCMIFDAGADPLRDFWVGEYELGQLLVLDEGLEADFLEIFGLNEVLAFARDSFVSDADDRLFAFELALGRSAVPLDPADAADPLVVEQANAMAEFVLRRMVTDDPGFRGFITQDLSDPAILALVAEQSRRMVVNEDGVRTFALRRAGVDVLKALQNEGAFLELRAARDTISEALAAGTVPEADVPQTEDLLIRIENALSPYFE
jgi:Met-zincin